MQATPEHAVVALFGMSAMTIAVVLFVLTYLVIMSEKINRAIDLLAHDDEVRQHEQHDRDGHGGHSEERDHGVFRRCLHCFPSGVLMQGREEVTRGDHAPQLAV